MPTIDLTTTELADAARGMRMLSKQTQATADACPSVATKAILEQSAKTHERLAERFQRASQRKAEKANPLSAFSVALLGAASGYQAPDRPAPSVVALKQREHDDKEDEQPEQKIEEPEAVVISVGATDTLSLELEESAIADLPTPPETPGSV